MYPTILALNIPVFAPVNEPAGNVFAVGSVVISLNRKKLLPACLTSPAYFWPELLYVP